MANEVTFQIKIETTGEDSVKQVTMDAEELGHVVKEVTDEQEKLNTKLLDINQAQQAIENITSGLSRISSVVAEFTAVYAAQETVEAQLAQVMRNTMDAREEDIQSIKDLCAAQQELGVIGDEVQLAGAQELATYLEKKQSLEQLIPVMNDMLAQQYGLEASQESAAQIATMLGKVMEGQTSALSRYGYSFDEAQEKVLKYGTEEERVAVLAEVVESSVGGVNAALRATPSGQMAALNNVMGDLKETVGACLVRLQPMITVAAQAGMAIQGITGAANGMRGLLTLFTSLSAVQRSWNAVCVTTTAVIRTLTAAMHGGTVGATTLSIAIRGLLIATGVGAAIAALTMIIGAFASASDEGADEADRLADSMEGLADADKTADVQLQQSLATYERHMAQLKGFVGSKQQEKKIVEEMNRTYGSTMGHFSSVAQWYKVLKANSEAYCRQMEIEAQVRQLTDRIAAEQIRDTTELTTMEMVERQVNIDKMRAQVKTLMKEASEIKMPHVGDTSASGDTSGGTKKPKKAEPVIEKGSEGWMKQEIQRLQKEADAQPNLTIRASILADKAELESELKHMQIDDQERALRMQGRKTRLEGSAVSIVPDIRKDVDKMVTDFRSRVEKIKLKPVEVKADTKDLKKAEKDMKAASEGLQSMGQGLSALGSALELPELNVAGTLAQAIATMTAGYAQATEEAATMGPWAWMAFAGTGLAQLASIISSVKNLAKFADGGVAYGPTLGLFGEYANAATNPEVVAPLDRLRAIIGSGGSERLDVRLKVKGRDLVGVTQRRLRQTDRG